MPSNRPTSGPPGSQSLYVTLLTRSHSWPQEFLGERILLSLWFVRGAQSRNYPNWKEMGVRLTLANPDRPNLFLVSKPRGTTWDFMNAMAPRPMSHLMCILTHTQALATQKAT